MTNPLGPIAGLATAMVKGMWALYDRKYGTYGEKRVKALQKDIEGMAAEIDALHAENERLTAELKAAKTREKILLTDVESLTKKLQTMEHLRDEKRPAGDENPF